MPSYDGPETADIVYEDVDGALTDYLIRCRNLDEEIWGGKTPKYFLEVKTTTQGWDTRFFMSKAQVKRVSGCPVLPPSFSLFMAIAHKHENQSTNTMYKRPPREV